MNPYLVTAGIALGAGVVGGGLVWVAMTALSVGLGLLGRLMGGPR